MEQDKKVNREYDPENRWLWKIPLTDTELHELKLSVKNNVDGNYRYETDCDRYTCNDCPLNKKCSLAFDPYNTDGDCLLDK